jgi:type II secretory pathway pseudopilin PulG
VQSLIFKYNAGFTYIGVLFAVALMGVTLALMATISSQSQQRDKELQLLFIGDQFVQAIGSYYENSPVGQEKKFPQHLEDLVEDRRVPYVQRHLRKIFYDPLTASYDWGLLKDSNNGIVGIYSRSGMKPIKTANFGLSNAQFSGQKKYSDWKFVYAKGVVQDTIAKQSAGNPVIVPAPEVIPPQYAAPPVPPLKDNTPENRRKRLCDGMHNIDQRTCFALSKKFGDAAGTVCLSSAVSRYVACVNGEMLSPLVVQYK